MDLMNEHLQPVLSDITQSEIFELGELQLSFVGGGSGDVILG